MQFNLFFRFTFGDPNQLQTFESRGLQNLQPVGNFKDIQSVFVDFLCLADSNGISSKV